MMRVVLADLVAAAHAGFALFIVGGLGAIVLGKVFGWRATENWKFRWIHLGCVFFVAVRAVAGIPCPLSVMEDAMRGGPARGAMATVAFRGTDESVFVAGASLAALATGLLRAHSWLAQKRASG